MSQIKIGVIGTGNMGRNHVRICREESGHFQLVGVYDVDPVRCEAVARSYETTAFHSAEVLLENVDAVVVAVPSSLHREVGLMAAAYGRHTLIEKPLSLTSKEAEELTQAFAKVNRRLAVGHVERFNPVVTELKKALKHEKIIALEARRYSSFDGRITDASVVDDLMIHDVDLMNDLLESASVQSVLACGRVVKSGRLDHVNAIIRYDGGLQANVAASRVAQNKIREVYVHTDSEFFEADLLNRSLLVYRNTNMIIEEGTESAYKQDSVIQRIFVPIVEPLRAELLAFGEAITGKRPVCVDGAAAGRAIQICEQITRQCLVEKQEENR